MDGQKRRVSELKQKMQKLEQFMVENLWYYSIVSKSIFCFTLVYTSVTHKASYQYKVISTYFFKYSYKNLLVISLYNNSLVE